MTGASISPTAAAKSAGVQPRTIQRWCRRGWVEHFRTPGGHIRFTEEQVAKLVDFCPPREQTRPEVHVPNRRYQPQLELVTVIEERRGRRGAA